MEDRARGHNTPLLLLFFLLGVLGTLGVVWAGNRGLLRPGADLRAGTSLIPETGKLASQPEGVPSSFGPNTIAEIVKAAGPAVVKVETEAQVQGGGNGNPYMNDPFFRQFFGEQFSRPPANKKTGMGSGFIISKDGYILTNDHVVEGANKITVTITGLDKPLPAELVGSDFDLDLAVLKVKAPQDLPVLAMGDSGSIEAGNWVIAIGNPYGLDHTVTVGVISAKGRPVMVENKQYKNLLQTDASINPGNSGGPLLNLKGEVIGINTAINAQAQGIGFAIPTSTVQPVLKDLLQNGKVVRPWLGVYIQPVTEEWGRYLGLGKAEGALIGSVAPGGPAEKAGLQSGDVIMELNKNKIKTTEDLQNAVKGFNVGDEVSVMVFRNKQVTVLKVTLEDKGKVEVKK